MSQHEQITDAEYVPDDELDRLLDKFGSETKITYGEESEIGFSVDLQGTQREYSAFFDDFEIEGFETYTDLGYLLSLEGNLGFAAGIGLQHARTLGVPTLTYTDEAPAAGVIGDAYQDLSVEWYTPDAVEAGLAELRLEKRVGPFDHDRVGLETLERYARVWLSLDSSE